jgi:hypothetical protein
MLITLGPGVFSSILLACTSASGGVGEDELDRDPLLVAVTVMTRSDESRTANGTLLS